MVGIQAQAVYLADVNNHLCGAERLTWYSRRAATIEGSLETAIPAEVESNLLKASFEGAKMVIGDADASAAERAG